MRTSLERNAGLTGRCDSRAMQLLSAGLTKIGKFRGMLATRPYDPVGIKTCPRRDRQSH